jgi:hypothetical protein
MNFLRQATASQSREIGPFVDDTDFKTLETALTILNTDIKLVSNGGAAANKNSGGGTHRANGCYGVTFDATDTANVGELSVSVAVSGALVVKKVFYVLEEVVYDAMFAASAPGFLQPTVAGRTLDVASTGEAGIDFSNTKDPTGPVAALGIYLAGTMQSGSTASTAKLASGTTIADDLINNGFAIYIFGGEGAGQMRSVIDWTDSSDLAVVSPDWAVTPNNTSQYIGFASPPGVTDSASLPLTRAVDANGNALATNTDMSTVLGRLTLVRATNLDNLAVLPASNTDMATVLSRITSGRATNLDLLTTSGVAGAVWNASLASYLTSGSTGAALNAAGASGDPWSTPLPGSYGIGTAGYVLMNRAASQASVDAIDDYLDTEIAAIKAKTDNLPADTAAVLTTIDDFLDTEITAIKTKTDNLPADTAAVLTTIDDFLDTEIAAIKAKTDKLTFTSDNAVSANLTEILDEEVTGDGSDDDPFDVTIP